MSLTLLLKLFPLVSNLLKGKKTYSLSLIGAISAISGYLTGAMTLEVALAMLFGSGITGSFRSALDAIATKILEALKAKVDPVDDKPKTDIDLTGL